MLIINSWLQLVVQVHVVMIVHKLITHVVLLIEITLRASSGIIISYPFAS